MLHSQYGALDGVAISSSATLDFVDDTVIFAEFQEVLTGHLEAEWKLQTTTVKILSDMREVSGVKPLLVRRGRGKLSRPAGWRPFQYVLQENQSAKAAYFPTR